jgi:hypothetical protein
MNRKNSILKLAGLLLVAGLALYFVSMGAFASDAPAWGIKGTELVYEKEDYSVNAEDIDQITIRARNMPVTVTPSRAARSRFITIPVKRILTKYRWMAAY